VLVVVLLDVDVEEDVEDEVPVLELPSCWAAPRERNSQMLGVRCT